MDKYLLYKKYAAFMEAYRKVRPHCITQKQAYKRIEYYPASRFYLSSKQVYNILLAMIRDKEGTLKKVSPIKRRMYTDLYETLINLSAKRQYQGMSLFQLADFVVLQPAKSLYIPAATMPKIYSFMISGGFDKFSDWNAFFNEHYKDNKHGRKPKH